MNRPVAQWLFDLGNSRLKGAPLAGDGKRGEVFAIVHQQPDFLATLAREIGDAGHGGIAWLASVANPGRTDAVATALKVCGLDVRRVETRAQVGCLRIAYADPSRLGVDRFLALVAASARDDGPWLLVSAGSALTIDLLDAEGLHHGGLISAMPEDVRAALAQRFPQLDLPEGKSGDFADNTADAIASGTQGAALGLVERALRNARERLGVEPMLLLSGGRTDLFASLGYAATIVLPSIVLDGLALSLRQAER